MAGARSYFFGVFLWIMGLFEMGGLNLDCFWCNNGNIVIKCLYWVKRLICRGGDFW